MRCTIIAMFFLSTLFISMASEACSCVPRPTVEEQYKDYSEVLLGVVTRAFPIEDEPRVGEPVRFRVLTNVVEVYKGTPPREISGYAMPIYNGPNDLSWGGCGPEFEIGHFYIVFRKLDLSTDSSYENSPPDYRHRYSRPRFESCSHTVWPVTDDVLEYLRAKKEAAK